LSAHLRLGLPSGLFPSGFPTNILTLVIVHQIESKFYIKILIKTNCCWVKNC
jgi:hypothetical protein